MGHFKRHLKRYAMPGYWPLPRKARTFVIRPRPGPHKLDRSIPLQVVLRDVLGHAESAADARRMLNAGRLLVDGKPRKDPAFPVGLMDVIEVPDAGEHLRVSVNRKGLFLERITKAAAGCKLCRIEGKTTLKGGRAQIALHDGRNLVLAKDAYAVGDSLLISVPDQKVLKHFTLSKGSHAFILAGRNMGVQGVVSEIRQRKGMMGKSTVTLTAGKRQIPTLREYVMVGETSVPERKEAGLGGLGV
jgi:small subunit ribosomal protein S4e